MTNLMDLLMSGNNPSATEVKTATENLTQDPVVTLEGVNAPEFADAAPFDMESAYEAQPSKAAITIPAHNDGLDDDDEELTIDHVGFSPSMAEEMEAARADVEMTFENLVDADEPTAPVAVDAGPAAPVAVELGEDGEPAEWNLKPFTSRYFNFGGRTINSFTRGGYTCFEDTRGMSMKTLKGLKGFGKKCLEEVLDLLDAENQSDWFSNEESAPVVEVAAPVAEPVVEVAETAPVAEPVVEVVAEVAEPTVEPVIEPVVEVAEPVAEPVAEVAEPAVEEAPALQVAPFKILVIGGGAAAMRQGMNVASFEQVFTEAIRMICEQASAASLASVEYGKGWAALGATIRGNGWPANVDVLTVSKSYMSRPEVLMELRLLADLVVEA